MSTGLRKSWFDVPKAPGGSAAARSAAKFGTPTPEAAAPQPVRAVLAIPHASTNLPGTKYDRARKDNRHRDDIPTLDWLAMKERTNQALRKWVESNGRGFHDNAGAHNQPKGHAINAMLAATQHAGIAHAWDPEDDRRMDPFRPLDRFNYEDAWVMKHHADLLHAGLTDDDLDRATISDLPFDAEESRRVPLREHLMHHDELHPSNAFNNRGGFAQVPGAIPPERLVYPADILSRLRDRHSYSLKEYYDAVDSALRDKLHYDRFPVERLAGLNHSTFDERRAMGAAYRDRDRPGYQDQHGQWKPGHWMDAFRKARRTPVRRLIARQEKIS